MGRVAQGFAGAVVLALALALVGELSARADSVSDMDSREAADDPFTGAASVKSPEHPCIEAGTCVPILPSIPFDLSKFREKSALGSAPGPRIYALEDKYGKIHPEREPLILVHGLFGSPADLQTLADHFKDSKRFQVYILAYREATRPIADNAEDFAQALRTLKTLSTGARKFGVTILAHSMGGIMARQTLNALALDPEALGKPFGPIHLVTIDSPWHGFPGPKDHGPEVVLSGPARLILPPGMMDMRANSDFFQGDRSNPDRARQKGVNRSFPSDDARIDMVFAEEGSDALDYTEGVLRELPRALRRHYNDDEDVRGDPRLVNFWMAVVSSSQFQRLDHELLGLAGTGTLTDELVLKALLKNFPRYPGNHMSVLQPHPGKRALLDDLDELVK